MMSSKFSCNYVNVFKYLKAEFDYIHRTLNIPNFAGSSFECYCGFEKCPSVTNEGDNHIFDTYFNKNVILDKKNTPICY